MNYSITWKRDVWCTPHQNQFKFSSRVYGQKSVAMNTREKKRFKLLQKWLGDCSHYIHTHVSTETPKTGLGSSKKTGSIGWAIQCLPMFGSYFFSNVHNGQSILEHKPWVHNQGTQPFLYCTIVVSGPTYRKSYHLTINMLSWCRPKWDWNPQCGSG